MNGNKPKHADPATAGEPTAPKGNKPVTGTDDADVLRGSDTLIIGGDGDDQITGSDAEESVRAGDGDDTITALGGDDVIFGNGGFDTARFEASVLDYAELTDGSANLDLSPGRGNALVIDGPAGTDTLKQIEALAFSDYTYTIGADNAPLARPNDLTTTEDAPVTADVLANDLSFDGDDLNLKDVDAADLDGSVTFAPDGAVTYDPGSAFQALDPGDTTTERFTYTVSDDAGNISSASVDVTIEGENDAPIANPDQVSGNEDKPITIAADTLLANDQAVDGDAVLRINGVSESPDDTQGTVAFNGDEITYTPAAAFNALDPDDTATDRFSYTLADGQGSLVSGRVDVTIEGENDAPVVRDDQVAAGEDGETIISASTLLANDEAIDGDATLSVQSVSAIDGENEGSVSLANGMITYTPSYVYDTLDEGETAQDAFRYTVADGQGSSVSGRVDVTIQGENDAPVVSSPRFTILDTYEDGETIGAVSGFDIDGDTLQDWRIDRGNLDRDGDGTPAFTINKTNGAVRISDADDIALDSGAKTVELGVSVSDGTTRSETATVDVRIENEQQSTPVTLDFDSGNVSGLGGPKLDYTQDGLNLEIDGENRSTGTESNWELFDIDSFGFGDGNWLLDGNDATHYTFTLTDDGGDPVSFDLNGFEVADNRQPQGSEIRVEPLSGLSSAPRFPSVSLSDGGSEVDVSGKAAFDGIKGFIVAYEATDAFRDPNIGESFRGQEDGASKLAFDNIDIDVTGASGSALVDADII